MERTDRRKVPRAGGRSRRNWAYRRSIFDKIKESSHLDVSDICKELYLSRDVVMRIKGELGFSDRALSY